MTFAIVFVLMLAAAAVAFVTAPLLRSDAGEAERLVAATSVEVDLHSRHDMLLASLKDLEEDRATEKIDPADYEALRDRLTTQAVDLMRRLDQIEDERHEREVAATVPHPSAPTGRGSR